MNGVCPACRTEVASSAKTCVHCGCKFKYNSFSEATKKACPMSWGLTAMICGIVGLGTAMFLFIHWMVGLLLVVLGCILMWLLTKKNVKQMLEYEYYLEKKKQSNPNANRPFINPVTPTSAPYTNVSSNANAEAIAELKRYKELLDADIITQQEFDEKKRKLLGM